MRPGRDSTPKTVDATRFLVGLACPKWLRRAAGLTILAVAANLSACGGGGDAFVTFDVGVRVGGVVVSGPPVSSGSHRSITMYAGQSIELDANEPVYWTLLVGGSSVFGGVTVVYAGLAITQTAISSSRIAVDTSTRFGLVNPVPMTLIATSRIDSAQVATVDVLVTN